MKHGITAAIAAVCAGLFLASPIDSAAARRNSGGPTTLVERPGCGRVATDADPATPAASGAGVQQYIRVSIPAIVVVQVDRGWRVVAAMTNTGCAPRPGDDVFYIRRDGSIKAASKTAFAHRRWIGDFTVPGVFVSQTR